MFCLSRGHLGVPPIDFLWYSKSDKNIFSQPQLDDCFVCWRIWIVSAQHGSRDFIRWRYWTVSARHGSSDFIRWRYWTVSAQHGSSDLIRWRYWTVSAQHGSSDFIRWRYWTVSPSRFLAKKTFIEQHSLENQLLV